MIGALALRILAGVVVWLVLTFLFNAALTYG
jgi:hypothetical protein